MLLILILYNWEKKYLVTIHQTLVTAVVKWKKKMEE